jgi:hypothetical protein
VAKGANEGTDEELQYVDVAQDLDPSPEGPKAYLASEGKPRTIKPVFKIMQLSFAMNMHLRFRSRIETLDA